MIPKSVDRFFTYVGERYLVHLRRKAGGARPWTNDAILQEYRFCNVFREDDKVTQWIRRNVRQPMRDSRDIVWAMTICRFINTIPTLCILEAEDLITRWDPDKARRVLADQKPLVTGAYMIKTPLRKPKLEGLIEIFEPIWRDRSLLFAKMQRESLQGAHEILTQYPWIGPFMSYEIVTDLRHTPLLGNAPDIMTWANPGPGATRGIMRILTGLPEGNTTEAKKLQVMRDLLAMSRDPLYWGKDWPEWEMREVEHMLCEFDKYERARTGEGRPKQRYNGKGE